MFLIKYNITIRIQNLKTKEEIKVIHPYTHNIPIDDNDIYKLFNTVYYIDTINMLDLAYTLSEDYMVKNSLTPKDIDIEEYTISSDTSNVELYFENNENNNEYTLTPSIMAKIMPNSITYEKPLLYAELIDNYSIKWSVNHVDSLKYKHILLDENDEVIANIAINEDSYTEFGLTPDTVYARKVIKSNENGMSQASDLIHMKTNPLIIETDLHQYKEESNIEYLQVDNEVIKENLKAFQSGIGDGNDLLTEKQTDINFNENCNLYLSVFGYYKETIKKYRQISFNYRIKATATRTVKEREGFLKFHAYAYPIETIKFIVVKMAKRPVDIQYEVRAYVNFYKQNTDGSYMPATKIISYKGDDTKYQITDPIISYAKICVSNGRKVKDMARAAIETDEEIKASMAKCENIEIPVTLTKTTIDYPSNNFPDNLSYDKEGYHYDLHKKCPAIKVSSTVKSIPVSKRVYYKVGDYYVNDPDAVIKDGINFKTGYGQWRYLCTMPMDLFKNNQPYTIDDEYNTNHNADNLSSGCVKLSSRWQNIIPLTDAMPDGTKVSLPDSARGNLTMFYDPNDPNCLKETRSVHGPSAIANDYPDWATYEKYDTALIRTYTEYLTLIGEKTIQKGTDYYTQEYEGTRIRIGEELKLGYYVDHYEVYDNYQFDMIDIYDADAPRKWNRGEIGSVKTCANYLNNDIVDPDSLIYAWGWSDGNMYTARYDTEKVVTFNSSHEKYPIVTKDDLKLGKPLTNICGKTINEYESDVMTVIEWTYMDKHTVLGNFIDVNKYRADGKDLPDTIVNATIDCIYGTDKDYPMYYEFDEQHPQNFIVFEDLYNMQEDTDRQYHFKIDVLDCSDNISIATVAEPITAIPGTTLEYDGFYSNYSIPIAAKYKDIKRELNITYPYPEKQDDPLFGIVNGRFATHNPSGKQDLIVSLPILTLPSDIDDGTLQISLNIESVIVRDESNNILNYTDGFINYKFKQEIKSNVTATNGDIITFFSNYGENIESIQKELVKTVNSNKIYLNSLEPFIEKIRLYKPIIDPTTTNNYFKYTLSVVCDNSDVRILTCPADELDFTSSDYIDIPITLKGDFSSTSMWHPKTHNGYYYINQKEYFLYSDFRVWNPEIYIKSKTTGELKLLGIPKYTLYDRTEYYKNIEVSYTIIATVKKDIFFKTNECIIFKEKSDLINTFEHQKYFDFNTMTNRVQCSPSIINNKYYKKYKDTDVYISAPYYSPNTIKNIGQVTFDSSNYNHVTFYISYFDNVSCKWSDWKEVNNNTNPNIDVNTNTIRYKIEIRNDIKYKDYGFTQPVCCTLQYERDIDNNKSYNVSISENKLQTINNARGKFMSKIFDFGYEYTNVSMFAHRRGMSVISIGSIVNENSSTGITTGIHDIMQINNTVGRYFFYIVDLYGTKDKVFQMFKSITTKTVDIDNTIFGDFGNVNINCTTEDYSKSITIEKEYTTKVPYDKDRHNITGSVWDALTTELKDNEYNVEDVHLLKLQNNISTIDLSYIGLSAPSVFDFGAQIFASSNDVQYEYGTKNEHITFKDNKCVLYPKPQQYCPVTIEDSNVGVLRQVYFTNKVNDVSLTNTEKFKASNNNIFVLKYTDLKLDSVMVFIDDKPVKTSDYTIDGNLLKFSCIVDTDKEVSIEYELNNSFVVDYKYDITIDPTILSLNKCFTYNTTTNEYDISQPCNLGIDDDIQFSATDKHKFVVIKTNVPDAKFGTTRVCYESNINDNRVIHKHLALNPVFNMYNEGFIYISYNDNIPYTINIYANPAKVKGNGKEICKLYTQILDKDSNPVSNELLSITCTNGQIMVDNNITDVNGIVDFQYLSYTPKNDIIDIQCDSNKISNSINITVV